MTRPELERIKGVAFDVDGVLTDGCVYVSGDGRESKRFSIADGTGLYWARMAGYHVAWVSGRRSDATTRRGEELGVEWVYQGVRDKTARIRAWADARGIGLDEVLYMGDDHIDLPVFEAVAVSVAPADAAPEVKAAASHVTDAKGGEGAVREAVRWLLEGAGRLEQATGRYRESLTEES